jgi:hypothetical protein
LSNRFFSGEDCFFINIFKDVQYKIDYSVILQVKVSEHSKLKLLLYNIIFILGYGTIL